MPDTPQFLATHLVDDEKGNDCRNHIHHTYKHLRKERVSRCETGFLEDFRAIVEHGVHAHELTEYGDGRTD